MEEQNQELSFDFNLNPATEDQQEQKGSESPQKEDGDEQLYDELQKAQEAEGSELEFKEITQEQEPDKTEESEDSETEQKSEDDIQQKEQEEQSQDTETSEDSPSSDTSSSSSSYAPAIAKALAADGVLSSFDENKFSELVKEKGSESEALLSIVRDDVENKVESKVEERLRMESANLTEDQKEFQDMLKEGIPYNEAKDLMTGYKKYESINDDQFSEDENLAKSVIKDGFKKTTNWSDSRIDKYIGKLDEDEVVDTASQFKQDLIDAGKKEEQNRIEEVKNKNEEIKKKNEQFLDNLKDYVYKTTDFGNGLKIDKETQDAVYQNMTTAVDNIGGTPVNDIGKKQLEHPVEYNTLHNLYNEMGLYNFDKDGKPAPDLSKLSKILKTDGVSLLEKELNKNKEGKKKDTKAPKKQQKDEQITPIESLASMFGKK